MTIIHIFKLSTYWTTDIKEFWGLRCLAWSDGDNNKNIHGFWSRINYQARVIGKSQQQILWSRFLPLILSKKSKAKMISISAKEEVINISVKFFSIKINPTTKAAKLKLIRIHLRIKKMAVWRIIISYEELILFPPFWQFSNYTTKLKQE